MELKCERWNRKKSKWMIGMLDTYKNRNREPRNVPFIVKAVTVVLGAGGASFCKLKNGEGWN
jgi:hypothetical protein